MFNRSYYHARIKGEGGSHTPAKQNSLKMILKIDKIICLRTPPPRQNQITVGPPHPRRPLSGGKNSGSAHVFFKIQIFLKHNSLVFAPRSQHQIHLSLKISPLERQRHSYHNKTKNDYYLRNKIVLFMHCLKYLTTQKHISLDIQSTLPFFNQHL